MVTLSFVSGCGTRTDISEIPVDVALAVGDEAADAIIADADSASPSSDTSAPGSTDPATEGGTDVDVATGSVDSEDDPPSAQPEQPEEVDPVTPAESDTDPAVENDDNESVAADDQPDLPVDPSWKALTKNGIIWLDGKQQSIVVSGKVCLREGPLEMFACTPNTKEYESLVVVGCPAFMVHSALLAIGAKPGSPVSFNPYKAASGTTIDAFVEWLDEDGKKKRIKVQEWIRHEQTGKPMTHDFVFGGSTFWTDEDTGNQNYSAEGGELMCVSNFSTATMDIPVASPQSNQGLWFTAFTERIPKLGTKIHLILVPRK